MTPPDSVTIGPPPPPLPYPPLNITGATLGDMTSLLAPESLGFSAYSANQKPAPRASNSVKNEDKVSPLGP